MGQSQSEDAMFGRHQWADLCSATHPCIGGEVCYRDCIVIIVIVIIRHEDDDDYSELKQRRTATKRRRKVVSQCRGVLPVWQCYVQLNQAPAKRLWWSVHIITTTRNSVNSCEFVLLVSVQTLSEMRQWKQTLFKTHSTVVRIYGLGL